jgi:hypothetical protein
MSRKLSTLWGFLAPSVDGGALQCIMNLRDDKAAFSDGRLF